MVLQAISGQLYVNGYSICHRNSIPALCGVWMVSICHSTIKARPPDCKYMSEAHKLQSILVQIRAEGWEMVAPRLKAIDSLELEEMRLMRFSQDVRRRLQL